MVVYGLLAVVAALVLVASRDRSSASPDLDPAGVRHLTGTTADGSRITLDLVDGKLRSFSTGVHTKCTGGRTWDTRWYPADGDPVSFDQYGRRLRVVERTRWPHIHPPSRSVLAMDAVFSDDRTSVSGRIDARGSWGRGARRVACRGATGFRATVGG